MNKQVFFVFVIQCLTVITPTMAKTYRNDYIYNWLTAAFYKIHIYSDPRLTPEEVCRLEGAQLISPMSNQELSQLQASINQYHEEDNELQHRDSTDARSSINLDPEAKNVVEMVCQVPTRDGYIKTKSVSRDRAFICKVEANDVPYDSHCRVHASGYVYEPSLGSCYKFSPVAYTWYEAAAECQAQGAHLAVINSDLEAQILKTIGRNTSTLYTDEPYYYHIGFRAVKVTEPRVFKTIFNETLREAGYSTWAAGEPNNNRNEEHCGSFYAIKGKLNDISCHRKYAFICEKEVIYHDI